MKSKMPFAERIGPILTEVARRAGGIESERMLPADFLETLREAGLFRMFVPRRYVELELEFPEIVDTIIALAEADASVAWWVNRIVPCAPHARVRRIMPDPG